MLAEMEAPATPKRRDGFDADPDRLPDAPCGCYSVADLCRRFQVGADKVHGWIRRGELEAVNIATNLCGRPQWRITPESLRLFEKRRSSAPSPKPSRRRRQPHLIDYWPDN